MDPSNCTVTFVDQMFACTSPSLLGSCHRPVLYVEDGTTILPPYCYSEPRFTTSIIKDETAPNAPQCSWEPIPAYFWFHGGKMHVAYCLCKEGWVDISRIASGNQKVRTKYQWYKLGEPRGPGGKWWNKWKEQIKHLTAFGICLLFCQLILTSL